MNNKKLVWYIIFVAIVASFVTIGVTYYFMRDMKVENNPVEIPVKKEKIESKKILSNSGDTEKITINKKEYVISYDKNNNDILLLNNNKVYTKKNSSLDSIYLMGDVLIIYDNAYLGIGSKLVFINLKGEIIKIIDFWNEGPLQMRLYDLFTITDNSIIIKGTSTIDGIDIMLNNYNVDFNKENLISLLDITNELMNKYNIKNDTVVSGEYRIKYLGDNKFSDMELVSKVTYLEYIKGL